ncbi:hypothetical protein LR69_02142 [Geobacillus sp. BCO2]|nr:hypothetical protein LR69_02142 [Geobacillus sp. BCO2]
MKRDVSLQTNQPLFKQTLNGGTDGDFHMRIRQPALHIHDIWGRNGPSAVNSMLAPWTNVPAAMITLSS